MRRPCRARRPAYLHAVPAFPVRHHLPLFGLLLALLWWGLGYPALWNVPPSGVHLWRQADSASIAYNYVLHGMQFWQPQLHQLFESNDPHTVGEWPLWYYLAACFGAPDRPPENALRTLHLLIFAVGQFALGRLLWRFTRDRWVALLLPLLIGTAPVAAYYAFNFLPNVPALGLVLVGWWGLFSYAATKHPYRLYAGMLAFLLAGLTKPTAAVSLLAILGAYTLQWVRGGDYWPRHRRMPMAGLVVLLGYAAWNGWMAHYKALHENTYFLAQTKPIWAAPQASIIDTFSRIWNLWLPDYGHASLHLFTLAAAVMILLRLRERTERRFLLLLALGVSAVFVLFFQQYHHHDYYYVELYVLVVGLLVWGIKAVSPRRRSHPAFRIVLCSLLVWNVYHARTIIAYRSAPGSKYMGRFNYDLHDRTALQAALDSLGVARDARIISLPDSSPSNTLYFLDRPGWTRFRLRPFDEATIRDRIDFGAKYLVITRRSFLKHEAIQPFLTKPVGTFRNSVFVYALEPSTDRAPRSGER